MYLHVRFWEDVHKYYLKVHISYLRAENGKGDTNIPFIHWFSQIKKNPAALRLILESENRWNKT